MWYALLDEFGYCSTIVILLLATDIAAAVELKSGT